MKDKKIIIDDSDFEIINNYSWHIDGKNQKRYKEYPATNIRLPDKKQKKIRLHNLIIKVPKGFHTDHINGNTFDNRRKNLRIVTISQNQMNSRKRKNTSSKYKGVYWDKQLKMWRVQFKIKNKHIFLGSFKSEIKAAQHYNDVADIMFGDYAFLNKI